MKKEKDLVLIDLEMLEFLHNRSEDGSLTEAAETVMKADPHLEKISALHRRLFCEEKK